MEDERDFPDTDDEAFPDALTQDYEIYGGSKDDPMDEHPLSQFRRSLVELQESATALRQIGGLEDALKEEKITYYIQEIAEILPFAKNNQLAPILSGIGALCHKMDALTDALGNQNGHKDKSLQDSIHVPDPKSTNKDQRTGGSDQNTPTNPTQPNKKTSKAQMTTPTSNPRLAHHPTRVVAQFPPNGIPEPNRWDPSDIVNRINSNLASLKESKHLKIVAASYNKQGNLILSTRADQTAAELLKHEDIIKPVLARLSGKQEIVLSEDKKWYKIQIDGVNTGSLTVGNGRAIHTTERIHNELLSCNPHYSSLIKHIVAKPRWLRTNEELQTTLRSSLVFALDDEEKAKILLQIKSLATFGRHCSLRAFQERPPVSQCRNCWSLDHITSRCKKEQRCRLCNGTHAEVNHQSPDPANCQRCIVAQENGDHMDTSSDASCPHELSCANCCGDANRDHYHPADSRRCPARLERYGTARDNEKHAIKSDNPWSKTKTKSSTRKKKATLTTDKPNPVTSGNRYDPLADHAEHPPHQEPQRSRQDNTNRPQQWSETI